MPIDALAGVFLGLAIVTAIVLHEVSHGFLADRLGDPTARDAGRLSLNPVRHIDPFGTLILPGILIAMSIAGVGSGVVFGWAKPVPVSLRRFERPWFDGMLVGLAGPVTNLMLALAAMLALRAVAPSSGRLVQFLVLWALTNVVLMVFNLLPIPPLDGSSVVTWLLPGRLRRAYLTLGRYGMLVLLMLFIAFPGLISRVVDPIVIGLFESVLR
ncbi:MAG: site-2 protease family protein [Actinomycetota bacterium]